MSDSSALEYVERPNDEAELKGLSKHSYMTPNGISYEAVPTEDVLSSLSRLDITPISRRKVP